MNRFLSFTGFAAVLRVLLTRISCHPLNNAMRGSGYYLSFTDEETEAPRGYLSTATQLVKGQTIVRVQIYLIPKLVVLIATLVGGRFRERKWHAQSHSGAI